MKQTIKNLISAIEAPFEPQAPKRKLILGYIKIPIWKDDNDFFRVGNEDRAEAIRYAANIETPSSGEAEPVKIPGPDFPNRFEVAIKTIETTIPIGRIQKDPCSSTIEVISFTASGASRHINHVETQQEAFVWLLQERLELLWRNDRIRDTRKGTIETSIWNITFTDKDGTEVTIGKISFNRETAEYVATNTKGEASYFQSYSSAINELAESYAEDQ